MKLDRYYRTLGVTGNEDVRVIKQAFMRVAQKYHPDKNPDDVKSTEKFIDARKFLALKPKLKSLEFFEKPLIPSILISSDSYEYLASYEGSSTALISYIKVQIKSIL